MAQTMSDLIFLSLEGWDDIWRRNQFVCAELAARRPERRILFVTPPRDLSYAARTAQWRLFRPVAPWSPQNLPNITVFTPTKWLPTSIAPGRAFNAAGARRQIAHQMRHLNIRRPVLWINDHSSAPLAGRLDESALIYDITDDWSTFDQSESTRRRIVRADASLCQRADAVIVCSQRLLELKRPLVAKSCRPHLVPNGVHVEHYATVSDRTCPLPPEAVGWPHPVFGYTGTVHPDRVDVDLLAEMARSLTRGSIALVGPDHLSAAHRQQLLATGRVIITGPVPYAQVPNYMRAFDVCIVPHRMTPFTESLNPIKLWEYLAAGKPIVSTDVAGFRDYPHLVHLAKNAAQFRQAAMTAVAGTADSARAEVMRGIARQNSWHDRV
ncbi:MAG TPA: glycosyltransferase, partial [Tepidisphaeraceae bacterium]|nr:glycosyltransferase [Tepidisphaeraceae bacterium]